MPNFLTVISEIIKHSRSLVLLSSNGSLCDWCPFLIISLWPPFIHFQPIYINYSLCLPLILIWALSSFLIPSELLSKLSFHTCLIQSNHMSQSCQSSFDFGYQVRGFIQFLQLLVSSDSTHSLLIYWCVHVLQDVPLTNVQWYFIVFSHWSCFTCIHLNQETILFQLIITNKINLQLSI